MHSLAGGGDEAEGAGRHLIRHGVDVGALYQKLVDKAELAIKRSKVQGGPTELWAGEEG